MFSQACFKNSVHGEACMVKGGVCGKGGVCMTRETASAVGTHPTGMHSLI